VSLSSLLRKEEVRQRLLQEFPFAIFPKLEVKPILFEPKTKRYALVGIAFDYLLRFYLETINPSARVGQWVAINAFSYLGQGIGEIDEMFYEPMPRHLVSFPKTSYNLELVSILEDAKRIYHEFRQSSLISEELAKAALGLAHLDIIARTGRVSGGAISIDQSDVADLLDLISAVNPDEFRAKNICLLNPTFGKASSMVGGADADLVIDDYLIEIKTTAELKLKREYINQLIGYLVLHHISGVGEIKPKLKIKYLSIYFSRYACTYKIDVGKIISPKAFPRFVSWFTEVANVS
jgi:hypothetical protein